MPKNILHITHTDIKSDSRILKEMKSLSDSGYRVSGIGIEIYERAARSNNALDSKIKNIELYSRRLVFIPRTLRHIFSLMELFVKILPCAISQKPDVVHCHDILMLPIGVVVKLFTGATLIYDAHELESDRNGLTLLDSKLTLCIERLLWPLVDGLIVVSPSIQKWYLDKIGSKPSEIILNSPEYSKSDLRERNYLREKFHIPQESYIFTYVGIFGLGRGLDLVVKAFTDPDVSSHVVFLGYGELVDELTRLAIQHPNLHVHEAVSHSQVVGIVKAADIGLCLVQNVSLSDYYCLPNKLFEYCFAGIPVLASDFPDISSLISEYNLGMCCSLDFDSIKQAVLDIERHGVDFNFHDLSPLAWQAQSEKLNNFYRQVLYK